MAVKPVQQTSDLFKGAFILTVAALITKILSAVYRIPFQNIVGDVGFYIYQQIYPFYGMAVVLATTGFPVVISKLYAEVAERGNPEEGKHLLLTSFLFLQLVGLIGFLILFFGAEQIAVWMHDPHLSVILKVVSFVFLLFPVISVLRGYFQGERNMIPTAVSQVGEQSIRVLTILLLALIFTKKGYSLYLVGGGAMFGSITGSLVSALILFRFFRSRTEWVGVRSKPILKNLRTNSGWIVKALIFQGFAICISGMLMIFLQMADSLSLYSTLVSSGVEKEAAKTLKGVYDRGQPLIQLGIVAATSMSLSLVPLITSERLKKKREFLHHKIKLSMQISLVLGIGASAGLWAIIRPTNTMLFENQSGSDVLSVLSFVIIFSSVISTIAAIMQGLGKTVYPAMVMLISLPVKFALNLLLIPPLGTMGAAVSTVVTLAAISFLLLVKFKHTHPFSLVNWKFWRTILAASVAMAGFLKLYILLTAGLIDNLFVSTRLGAAFQSLTAVLMGGILFLAIVIRGKVFSEEDLSLFPFGSKLAVFLPGEDRSRKNEQEN